MDQEKVKAAIRAFLSNRTALVVDEAGNIRLSLSKVLIELGINRNNIQAVRTFEEAVSAIETHKPQIVIADYKIKNEYGLNLRQHQKEHYPKPSEKVFILVTASRSEALLSVALEEDVDAFLLKPFSGSALQVSLIKTLIQKMVPSEYQKSINAGMEALEAKDTKAAIDNFEKAKSLHKMPTLAHLNIGRVFEEQNHFETAGQEYKQGLKKQPHHFKLLMALYGLEERAQNFSEAYVYLKKVMEIFPANHERLQKAISLAVHQEDWEAIPQFYELYKSTEVRGNILVQSMSDALFKCAKVQLENDQIDLAFELFKDSLNAGGRSPEKVIAVSEILMEKGFWNRLDEIVKMYPLDQRESGEFKELEFLSKKGIRTKQESIDHGRQIIHQGFGTPRLFKFVIDELIEAGKQSAAENLVYKALEKFPDIREEFKKYL